MIHLDFNHFHYTWQYMAHVGMTVSFSKVLFSSHLTTFFLCWYPPLIQVFLMTVQGRRYYYFSYPPRLALPPRRATRRNNVEEFDGPPQMFQQLVQRTIMHLEGSMFGS